MVNIFRSFEKGTYNRKGYVFCLYRFYPDHRVLIIGTFHFIDREGTYNRKQRVDILFFNVFQRYILC